MISIKVAVVNAKVNAADAAAFFPTLDLCSILGTSPVGLVLGSVGRLKSGSRASLMPLATQYALNLGYQIPNWFFFPLKTGTCTVLVLLGSAFDMIRILRKNNSFLEG